MNLIIPHWAWPLNFFQVHGTMCCHQMLMEFERMLMVTPRFCYEARTIHEANALILWGSISNKLAKIIEERITTLSSIRFIAHVRGCHERLDNSLVSSSLANVLPINWLYSDCKIGENQIRELIFEARKCLKAS